MDRLPVPLGDRDALVKRVRLMADLMYIHPDDGRSAEQARWDQRCIAEEVIRSFGEYTGCDDVTERFLGFWTEGTPGVAHPVPHPLPPGDDVPLVYVTKGCGAPNITKALVLWLMILLWRSR